MSGGGGSGYFPSDPKTILQRIQESEAQTEDHNYESEVANILSSFLIRFNNRDTEAIHRHLDDIRKILQQEITGTIDLLFGGSVAKHTYVDGLSDIDSLVVLNNSELSTFTPNEVRDYFAERLKTQFPTAEITVGKLAVTVVFPDAEIQLLPTIRGNSHLKIADKTGEKWSAIQPSNFTTKLSEVNKENNMKVVPIIKLAKAIIAELPDSHQVSGYHAESLAIQAFRNYEGKLTLNSMIKHYFKEASELVRRPIRDSTGQSVHVDEYLGDSNSLERRIVSDAFSRIARRMGNAENAKSLAEWEKLFGK